MAYMGNDGRVVFEIDADDRKLIQGLQDATRSIKAETGKWDDLTDDAAGSMGKALNKAFDVNRLKNWGIQLAKELAKFGWDSINLASDLQEVQNVVDVTFGDDADQVERWAKNAREQFGLTETKAKEFASTLGAMFKSSGVKEDMITQMSTDLSGLAADMASFYNLSFEEAFDKIKSGMTGVTMPLKSLGINMSESNLSEFAELNGQLYSQMSEAEKIVLRYQYLMQVTADAQGDFARTSDGFANQMRLFETNLDALKTNLGQALIPIATQALQLINGLFESMNKVSLADSFKAMFDEIDTDTEAKLAKISTVANDARDLVKVLSDLNEGTVTTENGEVNKGSLFQTLSQLSEAGGDVEGYLRGIGASVDDTTREYNVWLDVMKKLQGTIPGVSSVLNAQTGEIDGGTEALYSYIDAWQKAEEAAALNRAFERRGTVIASMTEAVYDAEADYYQKLAKAERLRKNYEAERDRAAREMMMADAASQGQTVHEFLTQFSADMGGQSWLSFYRAQVDALDRSVISVRNIYESAANDATKAGEELADAQELLTERTEEYAEGMEIAAKKQEEADKAAKELAKDLSLVGKAQLGDTQALDDITKALESFADASERIADIHQETWDDTAKSVDSVIKGFERFLTPAQKAREEMQQLTEASLKYDENGQLSKSWTDAESSLPQMGKMLQSMKDQITYMQEYQNMLAALEAQNVGADILAYFADGSMENYDILAELLENPTRLQDFVDLYRQREAAKGTFTSTLTDYKLNGNDEYQALVDTASEAISQLDMANPAQDSAERTVEGIAVGIAAALPEVTAQVNAVLEQVARLANLGGYTYGSDFFGGGGTLIFSSTSRPSYGISGSNAGGLDYVPFDGYLSMLHQGEAVLTAEEARVWRNMQYSRNSGIDYDALGGVMRDNVQAGGNVYLEGRTVGKVLSAVQADSYRGLERSGWQG